ncbi:MAG: hypothetical protein ACREDT_14360 [Methylocella sp.]
MPKKNLTYFLYGALVITDLAWVLIGLGLMSIYIQNTGWLAHAMAIEFFWAYSHCHGLH